MENRIKNLKHIINTSLIIEKRMLTFINDYNNINNNSFIDECKNIYTMSIQNRDFAKKRLKLITHKTTIQKKKCNHSIVHDYIDIDTDKGQNITYCEWCFETF